MNRLQQGNGNLVGQIQKLQDLGARASKEMPRQLKRAANDD